MREREGMGMGDVKMMLMVGAFLGVRNAFLTILLGTLLGSVLGSSRDWRDVRREERGGALRNGPAGVDWAR